MNQERQEFGKWWLVTLLLVVITIVVFTVLNVGGVATERLVFTNSYQKAAGDKSQLNAWRAQLASINSQLVNDPENGNLKAQKAMLEVQIQGMKD